MYPSYYTTGDEYDEIPDGRFSSINKNMFGGDTKHDEDDDYPWESYLRNLKSNKHMGEMADWMLDQAMMSLEDDGWDEPYHRPRSKPIPKGKWKMRDGTLIDIKKMTDSHISNAIALCNSKGFYRLAQPLQEEQTRRVKVLDDMKKTRDPIYAAFCDGWNRGYKSAMEEAYPDVGFSIPQSKEAAWTEYKKNKK